MYDCMCSNGRLGTRSTGVWPIHQCCWTAVKAVTNVIKVFWTDCGCSPRPSKLMIQPKMSYTQYLMIVTVKLSLFLGPLFTKTTYHRSPFRGTSGLLPVTFWYISKLLKSRTCVEATMKETVPIICFRSDIVITRSDIVIGSSTLETENVMNWPEFLSLQNLFSAFQNA